MNKNRAAAIDLGTYNCRLTIAETNNGEINIIYSLTKPLFLGKNLVYRGEFNNDSILGVINFFKKTQFLFKKYNVRSYRCIATEACRKAINAPELLREVKLRSGINVEIISAEEEAKLCLKSCSKSILNENQYSLIFDIGGGSTELIFYNKSYENSFNYITLPYGVLNLDEYFSVLTREKVINLINKELHFFKEKFFKNNLHYNAIGCCMTATSLACINRNISFYDKKIINQLEISYSSIKNTCENLESSQFSESSISLRHSKYHLLKNGNFIFDKILNFFKFKTIRFSDNGLKHSILKELLNNEKN